VERLVLTVRTAIAAATVVDEEIFGNFRLPVSGIQRLLY
jgi:hypothetical protein